MIPEKLTIVERQILTNQFRILSKLFEDGSRESINNQKKAEILQRGYTAEYSEIFDINDKEVSIEICNETNNILNMYRNVNNSIIKLKKEDKAKIDSDKIKFEGFDANNDPHYSYAKYMIEELDKWDEYKDVNINSHSRSTLLKYRKMLSIQDKAFQQGRYDLNFNDLQEMIDSV